MTPSPPTRAEIRQILCDLIQERRTRDEVTDWAESWMRDEIRFDDRPSWRAIIHLAGAISISIDRPYLYERADFEGWLAELDAASEPERPLR
jgi:hypothetical protein